jgi:hypothetical protein
MRKTALAICLMLAAASASAASISVSPSTANSGNPVTVSVNGSTKVGDWVQVVLATKTDDYLDPGWRYLNGTQTKPSVVTADVDLVISAASVAGSYEARLYLNGSRTVSSRVPLTIKASATPGTSGGPVKGSSCTKGATSFDIDHTGTPMMGSIYLCDDVTLKWLKMPQFSLQPW